MIENLISPTFDPSDNTWFTDDGVEAKSLAELQRKLPDAKIADYYPNGYGLVIPPRPPHVAKIINWRERKLRFKPEIEKELQRPIKITSHAIAEETSAELVEQVAPFIGRPAASILNPAKARAPRSLSKFAAVNWKSQVILDKLKALVEAGLTSDEIGRVFDCSRNAVIGICHRKGFQLKG